MAVLVCISCGYIHSDSVEQAVWADKINESGLVDSWCCPECGADKEFFVPMNTQDQ